jgi:hypothetical protein
LSAKAEAFDEVKPVGTVIATGAAMLTLPPAVQLTVIFPDVPTDVAIPLVLVKPPAAYMYSDVGDD